MLASHLGAVGVVPVLPLAIGLRLVLAVIVTASLAWQWKQLGRWCNGQWRVDDDGSCSWLPNGADRRIRCELLQAEAGVLWVRLLVEQVPKRRRHLLVWKDAVDPEIYRELRARIEQRRLPVRDRA